MSNFLKFDINLTSPNITSFTNSPLKTKIFDVIRDSYTNVSAYNFFHCPQTKAPNIYENIILHPSCCRVPYSFLLFY